MFIDDPTKFPGLEKNEDYIKFGYGYYVGAPWIVGDTKGQRKVFNIESCYLQVTVRLVGLTASVVLIEELPGIQWNFFIKDTLKLGPVNVPTVERLPLFGGGKCISTIGKSIFGALESVLYL